MLHLYLLNDSVFGGEGIRLGFATSLSAVAALTVLIYATASWRYHLGGVQGFVLAFAGVAVAVEAISPIPHAAAAQRHADLQAASGHGLFRLRAVHHRRAACAADRADRKASAQGGAARPMVAGLPPLLTLEKLLFRMIQLGFLLLTLTLVVRASCSPRKSSAMPCRSTTRPSSAWPPG